MPDEPTPALDTRPPYLSLTTLTNFLDRWGDGPIPPRIDKSALDTYSGATQSQLMSTLRLMGFVDQEGQVLPALREAIKDPLFRRTHLQNWAHQFYSEQINLAGQSATAQMLHESFAAYGYNGSTLRKAVVFYLALAEELGLPTSPLFRPPKQSATPPGRRRLRVDPEAERRIRDAFPPTPPRAPSGEVTTVKIGDLATITITVDAQWMKLPVDKITAMREAIGQLEALATGEPQES
jgi:hypothetical protein